jgi:hypothetical protein
MGKYKGWQTWFYPFRPKQRWQANRDGEGMFARSNNELLKLLDMLDQPQTKVKADSRE